MSYTLNDLMFDVIRRIGEMETPVSGITFFQAANSVQSLLFKHMLDRKSDLLATGDLALNIAVYGFNAALPDDFVSMAEKPRCVDVLTDWMAGTVTTYNSTTGALAVNVTVASGTGDSVSTWSVALGALPGRSASTIGNSSDTLTVGTGTKNLTIQKGLSLNPGDYIIICSSTLPYDWTVRHRHMQPDYLDDDLDHGELTWWEWYDIYGETWEPPQLRPYKFKIIGTTMYVRPKPTVNIMITGRYNAKPTNFTDVTNVIPWNGFFDEVFREGILDILTKGIAIPEVDEGFVKFLYRECDVVVNSRISLIPDAHRLKRANWM